MIEVERTDFVSVLTRDLDTARRFYGETLGIPPNPRAHEQYPEFETGNLTIALVKARNPETFHPSGTAVALRVPDVAAARASLEFAGVEFDGETIDTGVCHMAFFFDPDGNSLMLHRRYASHAGGTGS
jgi:catechol 2,3-dioxygenase-like lactoylglutathione lyase family enzyme